MISSGLHTLNVASKHIKVTGKNSRYIDSNSLEFDGNDDYVDCTLASDIFNKEKGTISVWGIFDTRGNRTLFHAFRNADNNADFFRIQTQGVSGLSLDGAMAAPTAIGSPCPNEPVEAYIWSNLFLSG